MKTMSLHSVALCTRLLFLCCSLGLTQTQPPSGSGYPYAPSSPYAPPPLGQGVNRLPSGYGGRPMEAMPASQQIPGKPQEKDDSALSLNSPLTPVLAVVALFWIAHFANFFSDMGLIEAGIVPRSLGGLKGLLLAPFIHDGWLQMIVNSAGFSKLAYSLTVKRDSSFLKTALWVNLIIGCIVWLVGRGGDVLHVGAAGWIFGILSYLIFEDKVVIPADRDLTHLMPPDSAKMLIFILMTLFFYHIFFVLLNPDGAKLVGIEMPLAGVLAGIICATKWQQPT